MSDEVEIFNGFQNKYRIEFISYINIWSISKFRGLKTSVKIETDAESPVQYEDTSNKSQPQTGPSE